MFSLSKELIWLFDAFLSMDKENFKKAIDIWMNKPHVLNSRIFGARVHEVSTSAINRTVYPKLSTGGEVFEEQITIGLNNFHFISKYATYDITYTNGVISVSVKELSDSSIFCMKWFLESLQPKLQSWVREQLTLSPASLSLVDLNEYQLTYERLKRRYATDLVTTWPEKTDPQKFVFEDIGIAAYLLCIWKNCITPVSFVDMGCGNGLLVFFLISEGYNGFGIDLQKRAIWDLYPDSVKAALREVVIDPTNFKGYESANWLIGNHSDELTPWLPILAVKSNRYCQVFTIPCCPFSLFSKYDTSVTSLPKSFGHETDKTVDTVVSGSAGSGGRRPIGRYRNYLSYLTALFEVCGFSTSCDSLRIPSTKKICILGRLNSDVALSKSEDKRMMHIDAYVDREAALQAASSGSVTIELSQTPVRFVPRDAIQKQLNCSTLDNDLKVNVCSTIFKAILAKLPDIEDLRERCHMVLSIDGKMKTTDGRWWYPGGELTLQECSALITADLLKKMKSEHGGLQTLLRNHHQAFIVTRNKVTLRWASAAFERQATTETEQQEPVPPKRRKTMDAEGKQRCHKTKMCWMFANHPDGCPFTAPECSFAHSVSELLPTNFTEKHLKINH